MLFSLWRVSSEPGSAACRALQPRCFALYHFYVHFVEQGNGSKEPNSETYMNIELLSPDVRAGVVLRRNGPLERPTTQQVLLVLLRPGP